MAEARTIFDRPSEEQEQDWGEGRSLTEDYPEFSVKEQEIVDLLQDDIDESEDISDRLNEASQKWEMMREGNDDETASQISDNNKELLDEIGLSERQEARVRSIKAKLTMQKTSILTSVFQIENGREVKFKKQRGKPSESLYNDVKV